MSRSAVLSRSEGRCSKEERIKNVTAAWYDSVAGAITE
jgi:hypothetical protein